MRRPPTLHRLAPAIIALVITGCALDAQKSGIRSSEHEALQRAQRAEQSGDYETAAREYTALAAQFSELKRPAYMLRAAGILLRGNHIDQARRVLAGIDIGTLNPHQRVQHRVVAARIALADNKPQAALDLLREDPPADTPAAVRSDLHELRADGYQRLGKLVESAYQRVLRESFIDTSEQEALDRNRQTIWQTLLRLPAESLTKIRTEAAPDAFSGWVQLARIAKAPSPDDIATQIDRWRTLYPEHPAAPEIVDLVLARGQQQVQRPTRIALLLPLSSGIKELAQALRDGFFAAHYQRGNTDYTPVIRVYDSGQEPDSAAAAYSQAVADGSDFVVGPLIKQSVNRIARNGRLPVPSLTLNYSDTERLASDHLYQFGLAPEDEARQVSERAWLDGHNHALAIAPEGEWGDRVLQSFTDDWTQHGGVLLETQRYPADNNDFSAQIEPLLDLDESMRRRQALEKVLQSTVKFEPRRRQDADVIFMAAFPRQGRLIRPQLKFHYAGDLPVYSTSHVFSGVRNQNADRDMDDVIFCDIPWVLTEDSGNALKARVARLWPESFQQYTRFYALGIDAYNIIPYLNNLRQFRYEQYSGETGLLQLGDTNRVFRQLQWARFSNGLPRPYN
ncbi:MAG: penicillin-binding protein activator [Gammaproteobacteria bacterium]|nr:penicillin-binding protein activator [Gammaproteobacteria bacterium]